MSSLNGKYVVVTRPKNQSQEIIEILREYHAKIIFFPTISIKKLIDKNPQKKNDIIEKLKQKFYHAIIFTSVNAVYFFMEKTDQDISLIKDIPVFSIGTKTAKPLLKIGISPIITEKSYARGLFECIYKKFNQNLSYKNFLFPRALKGNDEIPTLLSNMGGKTNIWHVYETLENTLKKELPSPQNIDWVIFTSPSTFQGFIKTTTLPKNARIACLGPTTRKVIMEYGLKVDVMPKKQNIKALIQSMCI